MDGFGGLPGGDQSALRGLNTQRVLQLCFERPAVTTPVVASATGLSRPTAQAILNSLVQADLLCLDGHDAGRRGGRPAQRYRFNGDSRYVAGVDIGAHSISVRIADLCGETVASARRAVSTDLAPQARIDVAEAMVREFAPGEAVLAVGIGSPGIIDASGLVRQCIAIPGWAGTKLVAEFERRLGCAVVAVKDTNLAVLAEHRLGAAQDVQDVLYVHIGHRLGVGVLLAGKPFTGWSGAAGEIGRHPGLGWEQAPTELFRTAGLPDSVRDHANEWVFDQVRGGDQAARAAVDQFAKTLADGIGAMVLALDPRRIVIGGGTARAGSAILEPIRRHLATTCYEVPELAISTLGDDAVGLGAQQIAGERAHERLLAAVLDPPRVHGAAIGSAGSEA